MDIVRSAKYIVAAMILVVGFLLGSCSDETPGEIAIASNQPPAQQEQKYTVRFMAMGKEIACETVSLGAFPQVPEVASLEGGRLGGWVDAKGHRAQPAATPVVADCEYTAVFFPVLDGEGAYLFTDGSGLAHPDAVLNGAELKSALNTLASQSAREIFPDLSAVEGDITVGELRELLTCFYTLDELDRVILGHNEAEKLSRGQFAEIMNKLLGRDENASVIPAEGSSRIPDVSPDREDYRSLMEACIAHSHSENGCVWENTSLTPLYESGYVLVEGDLYYADENGYFIRDTVEGTMTFGYDGRYTSGDAVLDSFVSAVIADIAETESSSDPSELLRAAYDYCCRSFSFKERNIYGAGSRGWEMSEALTMFEYKSGNSYGYTAVFWALARGLGYEAQAVNGSYGDDELSHAWVEIDIEGEINIFDPAAQAGAFEEAVPGKDMFMVSAEQAAAMGYIKD